MLRYHMVVIFVIAVTRETLGELQSIPSPATPLNSTASPHEDNPLQNTTEDALTVGSRISLMKDLTTLKNIVVFIGIFTGVVITCLVLKVYRSGRKIRKTRKYDIITTPAERIEMAPLNEDNDDEEDSTLFDVKYR